MTGSSFDGFIDDNETLGGKVTKNYYSNYVDCIEAVETGKASAFVADGPDAYYFEASNKNLGVFPTSIATDDTAFVFPKNSPYLTPFNDEIAKLQADEASWKELQNKWFFPLTDSMLPFRQPSTQNSPVRLEP